MFDYGIENGLVYVDGQFLKLNVYITGEKIEALSEEKLEAKQVLDVEGKRVLPGFIDPHVHFALGVGENVSKDDFFAGSKEALYGGVTTVIDFLDPVKKASEIENEFEKRNSLARKSMVDYAFHTTVANHVDPASEIIEESLRFGINSIKLFTTYADTDRRTTDDKIYQLLQESKKRGAMIVVHSENDELICHSKKIFVKDHEKSRPAITENIEVMKLAQMRKNTDGNLYIVHVSAGSTVDLLKKNFSEDLKERKLILESCPHYFLLNTSYLEKEDGYKYTMTPPIREEIERQKLENDIDTITTIGTDHCPYKKEQKQHQYTSEIPMGIGGIRYSFLNMYNLFGYHILDQLTKNVADVYRLPEKGRILPNKDADLVIFDEMGETVVCDEMSVYYGKHLKGHIDSVFVRGKLCLYEDKVLENEGKYIKRKKVERCESYGRY